MIKNQFSGWIWNYDLSLIPLGHSRFCRVQLQSPHALVIRYRTLMIHLELRLLSIQPWRMPTIHPSFNFASSQLKKMHLNFLRRWRKGQDVLEVKLSGWEIDENCGWASNLPDFSVAPDKNLKPRWKGFDACCPNVGTWSMSLSFRFFWRQHSLESLICVRRHVEDLLANSWKIAVLSTMERLLFQASLHIKFARLPSPKLNLQTVNFEPWYPRVGLGGWGGQVMVLVNFFSAV